MDLAAFFLNLVSVLDAIKEPVGISALMLGGVAASFKMIYWTTLGEILGGLLIVFAAATLIHNLYA